MTHRDLMDACEKWLRDTDQTNGLKNVPELSESRSRISWGDPLVVTGRCSGRPTTARAHN